MPGNFISFKIITTVVVVVINYYVADAGGHGLHVEVRGQRCTVGYLCPPLCGIGGSNSGQQSCMQTPLLSELLVSLFGLRTGGQTWLFRAAWVLGLTSIVSVASPLPCQLCHGQRLL